MLLTITACSSSQPEPQKPQPHRLTLAEEFASIRSGIAYARQKGLVFMGGCGWTDSESDGLVACAVKPRTAKPYPVQCSYKRQECK